MSPVEKFFCWLFFLSIVSVYIDFLWKICWNKYLYGISIVTVIFCIACGFCKAVEVLLEVFG